MPKPITKHLFEALKAIASNEGKDIYFVLGYLPDATARSYVSKLEKMGLIHTYVTGGKTEVWANRTGHRLVLSDNKLCSNQDFETIPKGAYKI